MDFVEGPNLTQLVQDGRLQAKRAAVCVQTLAQAISHAHEQGILHRDLKPSNVLIDLFEQPRITDFGLAKEVNEASGLTVTGQVLGSPAFASPEQTAGQLSQSGPGMDIFPRCDPLLAAHLPAAALGHNPCRDRSGGAAGRTDTASTAQCQHPC